MMLIRCINKVSIQQASVRRCMLIYFWYFISKKEREEQIEEVMELVKISDMQNRLIKNLSKGYKQRVGLAQAVLGYPEIIILDEPTVGLDPVSYTHLDVYKRQA